MDMINEEYSRPRFKWKFLTKVLKHIMILHEYFLSVNDYLFCSFLPLRDDAIID